MIVAAASTMPFTIDPVSPWSGSGFGLLSFFVLAAIIVGVTFWTYSGIRNATRERIWTLVGLRLAALILACLMVLRPSFALQDDQKTPSALLIMADKSESMSIQDQHNNQSRWDYLQRLLAECEPHLQQLRDEYNVSVVLGTFAGEVGEYDPKGKPDGKRTDFGEMLHTLYERHAGERNWRGFLILSDGADNGTRFPPLPLAGKWRSLPCPIHTFAFGQTTTTSKQRDISITSINPDPSPVYVKGKLTVKATIDAPGFEGTTARVRLFIDDVEVLAQDEKLALTNANEVKLITDAPATPGEIKVSLRIDPIKGELTRANNEISTFVTVIKEGISVLFVEGKVRAWEPKYLRFALAGQPSVRLYESVRLNDNPPEKEEGALFQLDSQHYDVIILGDITSRRFSAGNQRILAKVKELVTKKGTGLMMIGGLENFGEGGWQNTEIEDVLPVHIETRGQVDGQVRMVPTPDGLRHYVMRLAENDADNQRLWNGLPKLDGMTQLGKEKPGALVLAKSDKNESLLVGQIVGNGRTLAFGGDTTWRWCRSLEGIKLHHRFWQQAIFWLAKRDEAEGNLLVLPDTRRLPAGGKLGFGVKLRGKGGIEIPEKDARFDVTVIAPDKSEIKVPTALESSGNRGTYWKTDMPGEYTLVAKGSGVDTDGKPLENLAPAKARFVVYQDDA